MSKPKAPTPPDPQETAAAQTGTNLSTAHANAILGNVNQVTPYGNLTYTQSGQQFVENPNGQQFYRAPDGSIVSSLPSSPSPAAGRPPQTINPFQQQQRNFNQHTGGSSSGGSIAFGGGGATGTPRTTAGGTTASGGIPAGYSAITGSYIPQYTATQTLSPTQQQIFDQSQAAQINLAHLANQQSSFLQDYLGKPIDLSKLPAGGNAANLSMPNYDQFAQGPQLQTAIANAGNIQTQIAGAGNIQNGYSQGGNIQNQLGYAGDITRSYGPADGYAGNVQEVQDALFSRLNPQIDQQRSALETQLANQGIRAGSEAYNREITRFQQGINDQRTSVLLSAGQEQTRLANLDAQAAGFQNTAQQQAYNQMLASGQFANSAQAQQNTQNAALAQFGNAAQQQQFGQNAAQAQFGNSAQQQQFAQNQAQAMFGNDSRQQMFQNSNTTTAANNALQDSRLNAELSQFNAQNQQRTQSLNEAYAARSNPINEIAALLGGAQVQQPNFVNANMPNIPTVDYAGLVQQDYANKLGAYQQQMAASQGLLGGLLGLGAAGIYASDERLKTDIEQIGTLPDGQNVYEFRYKGETADTPKSVGLMAQEVEKRDPGAVVEIGGRKAVNYPRALSGLFALGASKKAA